MSKAIVCLSGGMDSCVTAAIAKRENDEVEALWFDYGQRTVYRERVAADNVALALGIRLSVVKIPPLMGTVLTTNDPVPEGGIVEGEVPPTYVPFRNGIILAFATSRAEATGAQTIYIGAVEEDSSGYPDCRPRFYRAFENAMDVGTRPNTLISIDTPVIHMRKAEIIRRGIELGAPLDKTWSCYQRESNPACGVCDSCRLRIAAFEEAGVSDSVVYA